MEKGQVPLALPPRYYQVYAWCIDASLPNFTPDEWIEEGKIYKVKHFAESLNTDDVAVTITDDVGEEIHPSESMHSFKLSRFELFHICLN